MTRVERRQTPRTTITKHAYINIEPNNGGIVLNVSEGGLCFHSFDPVKRNGTVRLWFAGQHHRVDAQGTIAWTDETQRAGLRFTALPDEARDRIRQWISQSQVSLGIDGEVAQLPRSTSSGAGTIPLPIPIASSPAGAFLGRRGFSQGLVTGLLLSTLVVAGFLFHGYRREFGESLIRLGERFAAKASEPAVAATASIPAVLSTPMVPHAASRTASQVPPPAPSHPQPEPQASKIVSQPTKSAPPAQGGSAKLQEPAPDPPKRNNGAAPVPALNPAFSASAAGSSSGTPTLTAAITPPTAIPDANSAPPGKTSATPTPTQPEVRTEISAAGADNAGGSSELFFEVGKFKNQSQAHHEIDKLAQLGFPATSVQKGFLWTNSYHILVGPYVDEERAKITHQSLVSSGFKPRPFERGSRPFKFGSALTLSGTHTPVGDCIISWESYLDQATVRFLQNDSLVATSGARWVKRDTKYSRDAYVYIRNADGSRVLVEVRFGGTHEALVFGKSS